MDWIGSGKVDACPTVSRIQLNPRNGECECGVRHSARRLLSAVARRSSSPRHRHHQPNTASIHCALDPNSGSSRWTESTLRGGIRHPSTTKKRQKMQHQSNIVVSLPFPRSIRQRTRSRVIMARALSTSGRTESLLEMPRAICHGLRTKRTALTVVIVGLTVVLICRRSPYTKSNPTSRQTTRGTKQWILLKQWRCINSGAQGFREDYGGLKVNTQAAVTV